MANSTAACPPCGEYEAGGDGDFEQGGVWETPLMTAVAVLTFVVHWRGAARGSPSTGHRLRFTLFFVFVTVPAICYILIFQFMGIALAVVEGWSFTTGRRFVAQTVTGQQRASHPPATRHRSFTVVHASWQALVIP